MFAKPHNRPAITSMWLEWMWYLKTKLSSMIAMNETDVFHVQLAPLITLIATSVITIVGLPLNIFLLIVFIKSGTLQTMENSFVANLIVADLFLGINNVIYSIVINLSFEDKTYERHLCLGMHVVNMLMCSLQLYALCLTFDRFMKVLYPFMHNRFCTKRNIIFAFIITYSLSVLVGASSGWNFRWNGEHYCLMYYLTTDDILVVAVISMFCIIMCIFGLNMKILMVARRQRMAIMAHERHGASEETTASNTRNIGKILGIVTMFTFVTYIPSWVYIALLILAIPIEKSLSNGLAFVSMVLWVSNPLVDTLTFLLCRKDIKSCTRKLLRPWSD